MREVPNSARRLQLQAMARDPETDTDRQAEKWGASTGEAPHRSGSGYKRLPDHHWLSLPDGDWIGRPAVGSDFPILFTKVDLARARDLLVGVSHEFAPLRQPPRGTRNGKQHSEHIGLESHRLVDDSL